MRDMNVTSNSSKAVLPYPTSFSNKNTQVILPLSNNDIATDVEIKENGEKYFVLLSPNDTNNGTVE